MNIAIFAKSWPRHNYNGHYQRTISLIQSLINLNHKLVVCSDEPNIQLKQQLSNYPMQLIDVNPKKISSSLNNFTKIQFKPNLFIFDSVETQQKYSAFLYNRWNKCSRVLALNQLTKLEKWRKTNYGLVPNVLVPNQAKMSPQKIEDILSADEIRAIHRCDYLFTSNQYVYHLLNKYLFNFNLNNKNLSNTETNTKNQILINYGFPMEQFYGQIHNLGYRPFRNRNNFVFIGNFDKQSNKNAIFILVNNLWPLIKNKLPQAQLHIYGTCGQGGVTYDKMFKNVGNYPNLDKENLKKQGILIKGILKDIEMLSEYKALLHPNTQTTSPHIKIIQSWFVHLPVVTTPIGAEGLFLQSYDPQFTSSPKANTITFSSQRVYSAQQKKGSQMLRKYYDNNIIDKKIVSNLTFGGSCDNFTYTDFADSAYKIYTDEKYWNKCLTNCHNIIKKNQNDRHVQIVIKKALINVEIATYEGRCKPAYQEQWKRYTKSAQFSKKLKN